MSWRWLWEQGTEALTLEIQPALCPVCQQGLYRNSTFLSGGWGRCAVCTEVVHYSCLGGGKIFKQRPRICRDCEAGRVRDGQKMPFPPISPALPGSAKTDPSPVASAPSGAAAVESVAGASALSDTPASDRPSGSPSSP